MRCMLTLGLCLMLAAAPSTRACGRSSNPAPTQPPRSRCHIGDFSCSNGGCVSELWKCDGDNDCGDMSDEQGCRAEQCHAGQFACSNGRCVPKFWKCDGDNDCFDGSDEQGCPGSGSRRCVATLCSSNPSNSLRGSDGYGQGHYGAPRGSRTHNGVDVRCGSGDAVRAPFDGILVRQAKPYTSGKACCNNGFLFRGTGEWAGYEVKMFYNRPTGVFGSSYRKGDQVATHLSLHCSGCYDRSMTDHTHFQMYRNGVIVDPTSFVYNC